jgi:hypothetical protein
MYSQINKQQIKYKDNESKKAGYFRSVFFMRHL